MSLTRPPRLVHRASALALALAGLAAIVAPVPAGAASAVTIAIGSSLSPKTVTVAPGTRITWVNRDGDRHRVRSRLGPIEFDSGNLEPGQTWSITLSASGTYAYLDDREREDSAYHGTIVVSSSGGSSAGGGSTGGGSTGGGPTGGGAGGGSTTAPPSSATVAIGDDIFRPATVTIAAGGRVTFRNTDDRPHTATGSGAFDTGILGTGASATERFPAAGSFAYLCAIHPDMRGTVRVVAAGATTAPPPAAPKPTSTPTPQPPTTPTGPGTGAGSSGPVGIAMADFSFAPASVEVAAGTTVTWTNTGVAPHTATASDGSFDSGILVSGGTWSRRFDTDGRFAFLCTLHPAMTGSVTVVAAAAAPSAPPRASAAPPDSAGGAPVVAPASDPPPPAPSLGAEPDAAPAAATASSRDTTGPVRAIGAVLLIAFAVGGFGVLLRGLARS